MQSVHDPVRPGAEALERNADDKLDRIEMVEERAMSAAAQEMPPLPPERPAAPRDWEWLWRFLALVMFAVTAWVIWVALQMSPSTLATPAAFEAAARAAAHAVESRVSRPSAAALDPTTPTRGETPLPAFSAPPSPSQDFPYPPVDLNRLKRAEMLSGATLGKTPAPAAPE